MASNRNVLKKYAPQARLDFIQAVTNRAAQFGITKDDIVAGEVRGDLYILDGKAFPRSVANQRGRLISRIARDGFAQVMEAVAYTWFNRFLAIRYMELHDYFDHGFRVLSNPNGHAEPEILENATSVVLPGLSRDEIVNFKLDGTKDEQIYRKLLIAQCNDLHRAMPFLFEKIDDETELLLPENLLQSDSIVRKLVSEIAEGEWQEIEIIGWLYQFYISEKKDQVIGKVVKSEDIPAATQLFTPNWIVKYMVQNSLGAQWLATYPDSGIRSRMEYYIAPADQKPEVQAKINEIVPKQLDPEAITLIDPAVGSGHILVEAYDLFRAIYLERGYTKREAARAILTQNLFGLDIDDRAAQMAGFALLMKACADDRTVLRNPPKLNVLALQDSDGLDAEALAKALLPQERFEMVPSGDLLPETLSQPTLSAQQTTSAEAKAIKALVMLFDEAKTFGSLITVPDAVMQSLPLLDALLAKPLTGDLLLRQAQEDAQEALKPLVEQTELLGSQYDCVVANPPYMGGKGMNSILAKFAKDNHPFGKSDLFSMFMERAIHLLQAHGRMSMINMQSWMFLSSFEGLRESIIERGAIINMAHLGERAFDSIGGAVVSTTTFTFQKNAHRQAIGTYFRLTSGISEKEKSTMLRNGITSSECDYQFLSSPDKFEKIEGSPIAYWADDRSVETYYGLPKVEDRAVKGLDTNGNIDFFVRTWPEVSSAKMVLSVGGSGKWYPLAKGGQFRRWYGNHEHLINFENSGSDLRRNRANLRSEDRYFGDGATWTVVSTDGFAVRRMPINALFDQAGSSINVRVGDSFSIDGIIACLNNKFTQEISRQISPTISFTTGDIRRYPLWSNSRSEQISRECQAISREDWNNYELSWDFSANPMLLNQFKAGSLQGAFESVRARWKQMAEELQTLEEENNRIFIDHHGLQEDLTADVPPLEITLICNPHYRYTGDLTNEGREARLKSDTMRELVSYAVGCIMGRYSLAEPGLIYADSGSVGFDPSRYGLFPADDDGIIPIIEEQWLADDAAARIEEFLGVAWPEAPIMETTSTLMDGLTMGKAGEPRAALRSYLSKQFYKDHLQTYKNRPIYWLFSSGKQKAFEALVYLHRYNEGTLARMRTVYVTPLVSKLQQRVSDLDAEIAASSSSAEKTRKAREKDKLGKQVVELREFDEELRHLADQRITFDLDDGVKVNYARFGNLLAAKDKVCPKKKGEDE